MSGGDSNVSLETLYDLYHRQALGLAYAIVQRIDAAEEIVLYAYMNLWRSRHDQRRRVASVHTQLMTSVRQLALKQIRSNPDRMTSSGRMRFEHPHWRVGSYSTGNTDSRVFVWQALAGLTASQRQMLELTYFDGLSQYQIAARLGRPVESVMGELRLMLAQLRTQFSNDPALVDMHASSPRDLAMKARRVRPMHGRLRLILVTEDGQTPLHHVLGGSPGNLLAFHQLLDHITEGFLLVGDSEDVIAYQLTPHEIDWNYRTINERLLIIEDDLVKKALTATALEDEGNTILSSEAPTPAGILVGYESFDVAITDGFHGLASAVLVLANGVFQNPGVAVVALFAAQRIPLQDTHLMQLRALMSSSNNGTTFLSQLRVCLTT